ncbi:MAG: nucleotidyltransferase [Bacilli bacterium]|nr:nucleotidyltransferase [Bacilli bacterium]
MEVIGLIAEYNPFHNGHVYQLEEIKKRYPNSLIILILNGYFLERGIISLESKEEKTRLALEYGVDITIELSFVFGSNSADIFAEASLELLNEMQINRLIFGSESDNIALLTNVAKRQLDEHFDEKVKLYLNQGINYPTALNKAIEIPLNDPNDLLGVSYIKAILKNNYEIIPETIKRTNNYHDTKSDEEIVSASNIREKIHNGQNIDRYIPKGKINTIDEQLLFTLLKYKIITEDNLDKYLSVDEGIDNRLRKVINQANSLEELINLVKTKRYTYNRLMRMMMHILVGLTKEDKESLTNNEYIRLLGLNTRGQKYINKIKKELSIPLVSKYTAIDSKIKNYELKCANIYQMITGDNVNSFEYANRPIRLEENKNKEN